MDEAYKILLKDQHSHWDNFKKAHGEKTVNYVRSILGDQVNEDEFVKVYSKLSTATKKTKAGNRKKSPSYRRQTARDTFDFLVNKFTYEIVV